MYTLRFPFELPPGREIGLEEPVNFQCDGYEISLKRNDRFFVLVVSGFEDEVKANEYIANVRSGLMWLLLNRGLAITATYEVQPVSISEDPAQTAKDLSKSMGGMGVGSEVHALFDASRPAILPTEGNFKQIIAEKVSITQTTSVADVLDFLRTGMSVSNPQVLMSDQKLQTAFELYGAFYTENCERARFITLIMVLEALAEAKKRPQVIRDFLNSVGGMIDDNIGHFEDTTDEAIAFKSLKQELDYRRSDSIKSSIKALVFHTLQNDSDVSEITGQASQIYDKRSKLVHDGYLPQQELAEATAMAREIVQRVLIRRFNDETGSESDA